MLLQEFRSFLKDDDALLRAAKADWLLVPASVQPSVNADEEAEFDASMYRMESEEDHSEVLHSGHSAWQPARCKTCSAQACWPYMAWPLGVLKPLEKGLHLHALSGRNTSRWVLDGTRRASTQKARLSCRTPPLVKSMQSKRAHGLCPTQHVPGSLATMQLGASCKLNHRLEPCPYGKRIRMCTLSV